MKTIFRKLRKNLLKENKFSSYFLYAIGEVLLLIIGVLIALQINNWNEIRKLRKLEVSTIINLIEEIEFNNNTLKVVNEYDSIGIARNKQLIEILKTSNVKHEDSINKYFSSMFLSRTFISRKSAYENLKTNNFNVIESDTIRTRLSFVYDAVYFYLEDNQNKQKNKSKEIIYGLVLENFEKTDEGIVPNDLNSLLENKEFVNRLSFYMYSVESLYITNKAYHLYLEEELKNIKKYLERVVANEQN